MSNNVSIYLTKFVDLDADGNEVDFSYGLRVADDYGSSYSNVWQKEQIVGASPRSIIELASNINEQSSEMIAHARECHDGIFIGGEHFTWDTISKEESPVS